MTLCDNCSWLYATRKGRCEPCYRYGRRTCEERPLGLIWRHFERVTYPKM